MILPNFFLRKKNLTTANIAKQRLHTIVSKNNIKNRFQNHLLPKLKDDLIQVIYKYIHTPEIISIQLIKKDENTSILKCNVFFSNTEYKNK